MSEESGSGGNGSGSRVSSAMLPVSRPRAPAVPAVESPAERKRRLRREFARITDEQILGFVDLWNQVLGDVLPQAKLMKGKVPSARRRKIAARLREYPLEWWEGVFQTMRDIPFLLGDSPGKWRADIDWLVDKPTNALRIMEGSFRDGRGVSGGMRREMEEFTKAVAGDGEVVDVTPSKGDGT